MDNPDNQWIFLTQANNENEANIIVSVLDSEGIPTYKKYQEAGEYLKIYMGMTNFGVDIYVPAQMEEKAKDVITAVQVAGEEQNAQDIEFDKED